MLGIVFKHQDFDIKSLIICKQKSGRVTVAAHRAAGVDCDVLAGGSIAEDGYCVLFQVRRCNSIGVIGTAAIECSILYGDKTYCFYTAIGDFETFNDSRLTAKFCVGGMRRSVQALRCPQSLRAGTFVQCEGNNAVSCGRFVGNKAAKTTLLGYISSSMSAEPPPKSRIKGEKVCETESARAASDSHPICPQPHRGDNRQRPLFESPSVRCPTT